MHKYDELCELRDKLVDELVEQGKKDGTLTNLDTLAHTIKNIDKIISKEMEYPHEEEYSGRFPYYNRPMYAGNMPSYMHPDYRDGWSQARRRDSMGRYSSGQDLVPELYSLMSKAQNDQERQQIQDLINRMSH